jgi:hypothetical protein
VLGAHDVSRARRARPGRRFAFEARRTFAKVQSLVFQRFFPAAGNVSIWNSLTIPPITGFPVTFATLVTG